MNHDVRAEIKQEDKKSMKKFIVIIVCSLIFGGLCGYTIGMADDMAFMTEVPVMIADAIKWISHYIILVSAVVTAVFVAVQYSRGRKLFAAWDGEDEAIIEKIEAGLSWALLAMNVSTIIMYVFMAIGFGELMAFEDFGKTEVLRIAIFMAGIIFSLVLSVVGTSKVVNFEKEMNPEKKGSAYDTKFQKKWLESCDEAEKMGIYKASFAAYKAVNTACMILWLVTLVGTTIWDYGIVPVIFIGIIWMVSMVSYYREAMKLSKNK